MSLLIPLQASALLSLSLEPQSLNAVADRLTLRGYVTELHRTRQLLQELVELGLADCTRAPRRMGAHYWLASGPAVDTALDQAYALVQEA